MEFYFTCRYMDKEISIKATPLMVEEIELCLIGDYIIMLIKVIHGLVKS